MNINAASTLESIREKNKMLLNNKKKNSVANAENQNPEIEKDGKHLRTGCNGISSERRIKHMQDYIGRYLHSFCLLEPPALW